MAFQVRTRSPNHTPQWYHAHCWDEDGGAPAFRAMLRADMRCLAADWDSTLTYQERVHGYEDAWNATMSGDKRNASPAELAEVIERELADGFWPTGQYAKEPFRSIARLMDKHGLSTTEVGVFLKWTAKNANLKKARTAKKKPALKSNQKAFISKFLVGKRGKPIRRDSEL